MNAADLTSDGLHDALAWTPNLSPHVLAAVHLLLADQYWLNRPEFLAAVEVSTHAGLITASIDWPRLVEVADRGDEPRERIALLRLACWIASPTPPSIGHEWALWFILGNLDLAGTRNAVAAFAMATVGRYV